MLALEKLINNFLTSLDIPQLCHKTVKKCEHEIWCCGRNRSKDSCRTYLAQERELKSGLHATSTPSMAETSQQEQHRESKQASLSPATITGYRRRLQEGLDVPDAAYESWKVTQQHATTSTLSPAFILSTSQSIDAMETSSVADSKAQEATGDRDDLVCISVSYDFGWAKRGRAMNSMTGVGANISVKTKVVGYDTRSKRCITSDTAICLKRTPIEHDCRRNHFGSSKSMEPPIAVSLAKACIDEGTRIACTVGDDDSSTTKKLLTSLLWQILGLLLQGKLIF